MDRSFDQMSEMDFDILKELGNIGSGNAVTALSQMLSIKIDMKVPKVQLLEFKELAQVVGGEENLVVGILLTLEGEIKGMMMFMLKLDSAHHLVNMLMGKAFDNFEEFNEMDLSALQEIGNIISGAYLSSLSSLTHLVIAPSIPYMAIDMAGAILSVPAIEFGKTGDKALLIQTQFEEDDKEVDGYFILIPDMASYGKILSSLGM